MGQQFSRASWGVYYQEIQRLYVSENKSLEQVQAYMKEKYSFDATSNQYQEIFREWGFRKNLTKTDWEFVDHRTKKRKASNMECESEVYLNGVLVPEKKVKREIYRRFPPYKQWYSTVPSPKTPPGIEIRTPDACSIVTNTKGTAEFSADFDLGYFEIRLDNLPSCRYQRLIDQYFIGTLNETLLRQFERAIKCRNGAYRSLTRVLASNLTVSHIRALQNQSSLDSVASALHEEYRNVYIEEEDDDDEEDEEGNLKSRLQVLVGSREGDFLSEFIRFAGYLSANNMLSIEQSVALLWWVIRTKTLPALEQFCRIRLPNVACFARSMFEAAIDCDYTPAVHAMIRCGVDPNVPMTNPGRSGHRNTPLIEAVQERSIYLCEALVEENVNVNYIARSGSRRYCALSKAVSVRDAEIIKFLLPHTDRNFISSNLSILEVALDSAHEYFDLRIFKILLNHGFSAVAPTRIVPALTALQWAALRGNYGLAHLLLEAGADVNAPAAVPMPAGSNPRGTFLQHPNFARDWIPSWKHVIAEMLRDEDLEEYFDEEDSEEEGFYEEDSDVEDPYEEYYFRNKFQRIVKTGAHRVVAQWLIDAGVDINAPAYLGPTRRQYFTPVPFFDSSESHSHAIGVTALQGAALSGSVELLKLLLEAGADVNAPPCMLSDEGGTALQLAISSTHWKDDAERLEVVNLLIELGADVNAPTTPGNSTALVAAIDTRDDDLIKLLIKAGADVNVSTSDGDTALLAAIEIENLSLVHILIKAGADVNALAPSKYVTALELAIKKESITIVELLLGAGADLNHPHHIMPLLTRAASIWDEQTAARLVSILIGYGADINPKVDPRKGGSPLVAAIQVANYDVAKLLLMMGADMEAPGRFSALEAAIGINVDDVRINKMVNRGAPQLLDPSTIKAMKTDFIRALIHEGCLINIERQAQDDDKRYIYSPLPLAAVVNDMEIFKILLDAGADINGSFLSRAWMDNLHDGEDTTTLAVAVAHSLYDMAEAALCAGANVNQPERLYGGPTALQMAAERGDTRMVELLLEWDADINADANLGGHTALQAAIAGGYPEVAKLLLDRGADVNAPPADMEGLTALQAAACQGYIPLALELLERGADPNAPAAFLDGRTAIEAAAEHGRLDMLQLLLNAGADVGGDNPQRTKKLALDNHHYVVADYLAEKFMV